MQGSLLHSYKIAYVKLGSMMQISHVDLRMLQMYFFEMPTNFFISIRCMCTSNSTNAWWNPTPSLMKCSLYIFMFLHFPCVWCNKSKDYASFFASMLEKTYKSWTWKTISSNLKKCIFWFSQFWWSCCWWRFQVSLFSL